MTNEPIILKQWFSLTVHREFCEVIFWPHDTLRMIIGLRWGLGLLVTRFHYYRAKQYKQKHHSFIDSITTASDAFILIWKQFFLRPCGLLVSLTYGMNSLATLRATSIFVLMHSGIVNGYQLLCDAHTVLEPHRGTAALFLFYSLLSFSTFSFYVFVTLTVLPVFLFLGASIVCVNNDLKGTADLVLWFPDRTSVCTHPWLGAYITKC